MRIVSVNDLASMFGVTPKTIMGWQQDGLPIAVRGRAHVPSEYESADCIKWLVDREVFKVRGENPKDRLHRLQGDDLEMKLAVARGELVHVSEIEPKLKAAVITAREKIRNAPASLAIAMEGIDAQGREALVRDFLDGVLAAIANWREQPDAEMVDEGGDDERPA